MMDIDTLINFIRGARHIVAKNKKVEVNCSHKEILMGIEERLLEVKLYEEQKALSVKQKVESIEPATLGQEGADYQLSN